MYLDFLVKVPTVKGKITRRKKSNVVYIEYEYDRVYDPSRKYTFPKRVTIGKLSDTDPELMKPNQNFLKYFPDEYSCAMKSHFRKFGNQSSGTRKSPILCLMTYPFLFGYWSRPCRICGA